MGKEILFPLAKYTLFNIIGAMLNNKINYLLKKFPESEIIFSKDWVSFYEESIGQLDYTWNHEEELDKITTWLDNLKK